jgi:hypothetical protein
MENCFNSPKQIVVHCCPISASQLGAAFLCRFEETTFAVCFKLEERDTLLSGRLPIDRNQIRFLLFVVNPHYEEDPTSTSELNSFTHLRNVHGSPSAIPCVKYSSRIVVGCRGETRGFSAPA